MLQGIIKRLEEKASEQKAFLHETNEWMNQPDTPRGELWYRIAADYATNVELLQILKGEARPPKLEAEE